MPLPPQSITDSPEHPNHSTSKTLQQMPLTVASGVLTGLTNGTLFHPWDRALYLAMSNTRPFFYDWKQRRVINENFTEPYHGFLQTLANRTIANGVYFIAQRELTSFAYPYLRQNLHWSESTSQLSIGLMVGSITGFAMGGLYSIKYETWNNLGSTFLSSARAMWSQGGIRPFMRGIPATIYRDGTFGTLYEMLRHLSPKDERGNINSFLPNALAAGVATIVASPLNYVRSIQYKTPAHTKPPTTSKVLKDVFKESTDRAGLLPKLGFFHQRFQVGWGTARVAVGMAVGQKIFDSTNALLEDKPSEPSPK